MADVNRRLHSLTRSMSAMAMFHRLGAARGPCHFRALRSHPKHEDYPHHGCAEAYTGAEKLNDIHSAIHLEAGALCHPEKSDKANHYGDNPDRDRRSFAIDHLSLLRDNQPAPRLAYFWAVGLYKRNLRVRSIANCRGCTRLSPTAICAPPDYGQSGSNCCKTGVYTH